MKDNVFAQGLSILLIFFIAWFGLSQINWVKIFQVKSRTDQLEERIGKEVWRSVEASSTIIHDKTIDEQLDSLLTRITEANDLDKEHFKLHVIEDSQVNAFTLPGGYIIINSGLIKDAENGDELAGVLGHEMAHVELRHVMERLVRDLGLAVLMSSSGNGGMISQIIQNVTSNSFNREDETEADITSSDYLMNAKINPEGLANFLYRMGLENDEGPSAMGWARTHPISEDRAEEIINHTKDSDIEYTPAIKPKSFEKMKARLAEIVAEDDDIYDEEEEGDYEEENDSIIEVEVETVDDK